MNRCTDSVLLLAALLLAGCDCPTGSPPKGWGPMVLVDQAGKEYYVEYIADRCIARVREVQR